ncbi:MAG: hypothetical protein IPH12_06845 [Saprospirales bacterium]|nr:hypothetical protein [Saprospirales bacterium]MBK8923279.1 hypothetical protein [Saprospirales bacterium]
MEIQSIRELLRQGETGKALEALTVYLELDARYTNNFLRTIRVLEANFNTVRQKELKGILPFQEAQREYSRANDALLAILDDLEAGRIPADALRAAGPGRRAAWLGGLVLLAVAGFLVWRFLSKNTAGCPAFERKQALHVLVLPFDRLGAQPAQVDLRIQQDISALTRRVKIPVEVKIAPPHLDNSSSLELAERQGKNCSVDLVIYGQYKAYEKDSIRVNLGFSFIGGNMSTADLPFNTFRDITDVKVPRGLEDALFSVCSMIAMRAKKLDVAERWMNKIKEKDATETKMAQWIAEKKALPLPAGN